ncbi:hypothetical protein E5329_20065 [Petralouisia muris]|mgnify:CR=1 FL=1|uniref:Uncharacterized protein n=1 Tax=Petralouisia muris TaxID=3032872 RepID=A0AC61RRN4_9FIRM|nr:hypothetical protein [Petralouisia muris]TGY91793.1 hypothetical protein E5329_20065 [Petralouisia muris]
MRKEKYKAKCPKQILMADPAYFEGDGKNPYEYDRMAYEPPPGFKMGILLSERWDPVLAGETLYMMGLYFAPEENLDRYMDFGIEECYSCSQYYVVVDNVRYRVTADGRQHDVETGAEGDWGLYQEFYSLEGKSTRLCAVHIGFLVPKREAFERMREMMYSLFEGVQPERKEKHPGKKRDSPCR